MTKNNSRSATTIEIGILTIQSCEISQFEALLQTNFHGTIQIRRILRKGQ